MRPCQGCNKMLIDGDYGAVDAFSSELHTCATVTTHEKYARFADQASKIAEQPGFMSVEMLARLVERIAVQLASDMSNRKNHNV